MTRSHRSSPYDDDEEDDRMVARLLELEAAGFDADNLSILPAGAEVADDFLHRLRRTQSLLQLVGRIGDASHADRARAGGVDVSDDPLARSDTADPQSADDGERVPPARIGRFEIQGELGRGGCGIVFRAFDPALGRTVALKVPRPGALLSNDMQQRFLREALAAASLDHPNITAIHEAGEDNYLYYIASAYCSGPTLNEWQRRRTGLPSCRLAAQIVLVLSDAVQHAHNRGVLHRDLKPGNVMLVDSSEGESAPGAIRDTEHNTAFVPRLTDFGLARLDEHPGQSTATGIVVGTFNYMAPEQAGGRGDITTAVDVYGLGAILYELLTGQPPRQASGHAELIELLRSGEVSSIRKQRSEVPADLETICLKCLAYEAAQRYSSAQQVAEELRRFLDGEPILARRAGSLERTLRWCRRRPLVSALTAAVALLCITLLTGCVVVALMLHNEQHATAAQLKKTMLANRELQSANRMAESRTIEALLAQAGRSRSSGRSGRRFDGIEALTKAAEIARRLEPARDTLQQLRNELLACLALPDLRADAEWPGYPKGSDETGIAVSPAADLYAMFVPDGALSIRRMDDNGEVRRITDIGYSGEIKLPLRYVLRFSPDGTRIASVGENANRNHNEVPTRVWDVATGETLFSAPPEGSWLANDVDFSADSSSVAVGYADGSVRIHDVSTGTETSRIDPAGQSATPTIVRLSPDSRLLAIARDNAVEIRKVVDKSLLKTFDGTANIRSLVWSPAGTQLAWTREQSHGVWISSPKEADFPVRQLFKDMPIIHVAFHPDDRVVAVVGSRTTTLFDLASERKLLEADGLAIQFSGDGHYLSFGLVGSRVGRWEYSGAEDCIVAYIRNAMTRDSACLSFSRNNVLAVCCEDGVRLLHPATATIVGHVPAAPAILAQFLLSQQALVTVSPFSAQSWPMEPAEDSMTGFAPGTPRLLADANSSQIYRGEIDLPEQEILIRRNDETAEFVALSGDDVPRSASFEHFWTITADPGRRWAVTTYWHNSAILWDAKTFQPLRDLDCIRARAEFSRDGRWLVVGNSHEYRVTSVGDWREVCYVDRDLAGQGLGATAFSHDSRILAVADAMDTVRLFDTSDWQELATLTMPISSPAHWLTFSPDRSYLAACTGSGFVCIWNLKLLSQRLQELDPGWKLPAADAD